MVLRPSEPLNSRLPSFDEDPKSHQNGGLKQHKAKKKGQQKRKVQKLSREFGVQTDDIKVRVQ